MSTEQVAEGGAATTTAAEELSLLDRIVQEGKMAIEPSQSDYAKKLLGQFATQILDEGMKAAPDKGVATRLGTPLPRTNSHTDCTSALSSPPNKTPRSRAASIKENRLASRMTDRSL